MTMRLKGLQAGLAVSAALWLAAAPAGAVTITNTGTGNIAGNNGTLSSGSVSLDVQSLGIYKRVYDLAGTELTGGNNKVAKGQTVWVLLYVDNTSNAAVQDIRIRDNLGDANGDGTATDPSGFSYVANSLELLSAGSVTTATTPGSSSTIQGWFHTGTWQARTDLASVADDLGVTGSAGAAIITLGKTDNAQVDLLPMKITAFRFKVTIN